MMRKVLVFLIALSQSVAGPLAWRGTLAQPYNPPKSGSGSSYSPVGQDLGAGKSTATGSVTARTLSDRAADVFNPKDYGAIGNNTAHTIGSTLGVTTLAGLAAYNPDYSWVSNSVYGLNFTLSTNVAQTTSAATINYTLPTTNTQSGLTSTAYNYAAQADFVLPGMTVAGNCIAANTTVSAVATGLPFSITTSLASAAGSSTIQMPFTGGITVGTTLQSTVSNAIPSGATVTALNAASTQATAYVTTTTGSTTITVTGGTTPTLGQLAAPSLRGDTGTQLLVFPPLTTVTAVNGNQVTMSNTPNFAGSYLPLVFETAPSITISSPLTAAIPARTPIYFGGISQVTLSNPTSSACAANTALTFSYSNSMVQALDMDWLGLQSAVVAATNTVTGGAEIRIPAGIYNLSRMLALPNADAPLGLSVRGDGTLNTVLKAQQDTGRGTCAMGENNRAGGDLTASYSGFQLVFMNAPYAVGLEPAGMSGLCIGEAAQIYQVDVRSFHAGYEILNDHQKIARSQADYNWFGLEMAANSNKAGNQDLENNEFLAEGLSSLAAGWNYGIDSSIITNTHTGFSPYGYYREGAPYGSSVTGWLTNTQLNNVGGEALGNGWMYGENGAYDMIASDIFIETSPSIDPSRGFNLPSQGMYGVFVVGQLTTNTFISSNINMSNGGSASDSTMVTCALICAQAPSSLIGSNRWMDSLSSTSMIAAAGTTTQSFTAAPIFTSQYAANNTWTSGAASGSLVSTDTAVTVGEVMAYTYSYTAAGTTPMTSGGVARGVAANAAPAGGVVAVIEQGVASVNATNYGSSASPAYLSTTTPTSVTTGTASDANTAVRLGIFIAGNQIVVRISP